VSRDVSTVVAGTPQRHRDETLRPVVEVESRRGRVGRMGTVTFMGTMPVDTRAEEQRDHVAIADVVTRAFGSPAEARLVDAIRSAPEYLPDLALVAVVDEKIVGHVMISRCTVLADADTAASPAVMLSPLAVDPDHQHAGIGGRLVGDVTDRAAGAGHPFVVLEGDPRYYSRFGFEPAATYRLRLPLPDWAPTEAAQVLRLDPDVPVPSGRVVYPASFDVLDDE
jgi:putative acetyltransferase